MFLPPPLRPFFYQRGYGAPATLPQSLEDFVWEIGGTSWEEGPLGAPLLGTLPQTLRLVVTPTPQPLPGPSPVVQLVVEGEALRPLSLYGPRAGDPPWASRACYRGVQLAWAGQGFYLDGSTQLPLGPQEKEAWGWGLKQGDPLYLKPFGCQQEAVVEHLSRLPDGRLHHRPPNVIGQVLRPYGGLWDPEKKMAQPVYYALREKYPRETDVQLYLRETTPSSHVHFHPSPTEEESLTLQEALMKGYAVFPLHPPSAPAAIPYRSTAYDLTAGGEAVLTFERPTQEA